MDIAHNFGYDYFYSITARGKSMNLVIQRALSIVGSQKRLADECGVSQPAVHKWLNGGMVSPEKVKAIVTATGGVVQAHEIRPDLPELFPHPEQAA
jgi:DNA-binding transcriptional regulator YdaS (Cro superfamily)